MLSVIGDLQRTIGDRVRAHRAGLGISQEKFAEQLGYHRNYIGGIERGERNLTLKSVEALAERLSVAPLDLLKSPGIRART